MYTLSDQVAQSPKTISNRMSSIPQILPPPSPTVGKIVEVEAADEGPKVKPKRVLTEAQLEALKMGRAKLAEKRRQLAESNQHIAETPLHVEKTPTEKNEEEEVEEVEEYSGVFCTIV